jgi:hypothetical protein
LVDQIVLATDRPPPTPYHGSFKVTGAKLDLRKLTPGLVLSCALTGERQGHRGSEAVTRLRKQTWENLLDAAWLDLNATPGSMSVQVVQQITGITNEASAGGVRGTMLDLAAKYHDPNSTLLEVVYDGLRNGKLVIVDLSLMRGQGATVTSAILVKHIFEYNVRQHTMANGRPLAVITLIEEAQKVLEGGDTSHAPFIDWVKEGRKYGLGSVLVTQQPGAIDEEILSQTDNFFVFHLVSGKDLNALKQANGNFTEDILATLLNEPIEGQGVFWSSAGHQKSTYPIPFRAFDFGAIHQRLPANVTPNAPANYAAGLRGRLQPGPAPAAPAASPTSGLKIPNLSEISDTAKTFEIRSHGDATMDALFTRSEFPLFAVNTWLRDTCGRKRGLEPLAIEIVTLRLGLYGYGWDVVQKRNRNGGPYNAVRRLNPTDGIARLNNGEDPLLPDDTAAAEGADAAPEGDGNQDDDVSS